MYPSLRLLPSNRMTASPYPWLKYSMLSSLILIKLISKPNGTAAARRDHSPIPAFADGGYVGDKLRAALRRIGKRTLGIIKRSDAAKSFKVLRRP